MSLSGEIFPRAMPVVLSAVLASALFSLPCLGQLPAASSSSLVAPGSSSPVYASPSAKSSRVVAPGRDEQHVDLYEGPVRPFSSVALAVNAGTMGIGAEAATPLSRTLNLRGGADFLNFGYDFTVDAAQYQSQAHLRSGHVGIDFHPMGGGFRISPQVLLFQSSFAASVSVAGGNGFELGNSSYLSSPTDPVHGSASISMGQHAMPALTIGWGNLVGRRHRWSVPFEIGVAYTGHYTLDLNLAGTACLNYIYCMSTTSAQVQQSVQQEESDLNETMKHFQIYPVLRTGFAYRF